MLPQLDKDISNFYSSTKHFYQLIFVVGGGQVVRGEKHQHFNLHKQKCYSPPCWLFVRLYSCHCVQFCRLCSLKSGSRKYISLPFSHLVFISQLVNKPVSSQTFLILISPPLVQLIVNMFFSLFLPLHFFVSQMRLTGWGWREAEPVELYSRFHFTVIAFLYQSMLLYLELRNC